MERIIALMLLQGRSAIRPHVKQSTPAIALEAALSIIPPDDRNSGA